MQFSKKMESELVKKEREVLLSVILPVYNVEKYLRKCIESIKEQTYQNLEIILVDDGSTDDSGKICDEYASGDEGIHVVHTINRGVLAARLVGVERASGEYISFVDPDDWINERMYEKLLQSLEYTHAQIVISGINRYWNKNNIFEDLPCLEEGVYRKEDIENKIIPIMLWNVARGRQELDPSLCSKIFERRLLKKYLQKAQQLKIYLGEDTSIIYPMILEAEEIIVVKGSYYYHRQREKGKIASYITDEFFFERLFELFLYLKEAFEKSRHAKILLKQLDYFYMRFIQLRRECYIQIKETNEFLFPYNAVPEGTDIILYGAGRVGITYKKQNDKYHFCNIILWVDKNAQESNKLVCMPKEIEKYKYDYILIAVHSPELAKEINEELLQAGINQHKIIWSGTNIQKII